MVALPEPFLAWKFLHIVQGFWGNTPVTVLIELWKLPLRSAQPTQHASLSFCYLNPHPDKNILVVVQGNQHQTARSAAHPITHNASVKVVVLRHVLNIHGFSSSLLSPFVRSPFFKFPDFQGIGRLLEHNHAPSVMIPSPFGCGSRS
jgi:hypothetical protein